MNNTSVKKKNKLWGPLQWFASFLFFSIFATTVGTALYYRNNTFDYQISPALLTVDSLITGATITLIAFTNFSPVSSGSSSLFRRIYWVTGQLTRKSKCRERTLWMITGAFIKPHFSIFISTCSTFITIILFQILQHNNAFFFIQTILMIIITFWIFFGTLTRYYLFNKYALRTSAKYLRAFFLEKVANANYANKSNDTQEISKKGDTQEANKVKWFKKTHEEHINSDIKKFVEYSNLLRATNNFELLQEIIWMFAGDEKVYENLKMIDNEKKWTSDFEMISKISHPSSEQKNVTDAYKLLLWNIFATLSENNSKDNNWKLHTIKNLAIQKLKNSKVNGKVKREWSDWIEKVIYLLNKDVDHAKGAEDAEDAEDENDSKRPSLEKFLINDNEWRDFFK